MLCYFQLYSKVIQIYMHVLSHLCHVPTLCDTMDCIPPGSSVHEILQARVLEWVVISSSGDLPHPRIEPTSHTSPALAGRFFTTSTAWEALTQCLPESK